MLRHQRIQGLHKALPSTHAALQMQCMCLGCFFLTLPWPDLRPLIHQPGSVVTSSSLCCPGTFRRKGYQLTNNNNVSAQCGKGSL